VLYVGNLVDALATLLEAPTITQDCFFVADDEQVSTPDFIRRTASALGRPARLFHFPVPVLRALASAGDTLSSVVPVPLDSAGLDSLVGTLTVDDRKARQLGVQPAYGIDEGLRLTAEWYVTSSAQARVHH
jgi:nucleoside-diphosphate-sugar epimerase